MRRSAFPFLVSSADYASAENELTIYSTDVARI